MSFRRIRPHHRKIELARHQHDRGDRHSKHGKHQIVWVIHRVRKKFNVVEAGAIAFGYPRDARDE
jgi:hypothetical protein